MASKFVLVVNTNNDGNTTASEIGANVASNGNTIGAGAPAAIDNIAAFIQSQQIGRGINVVVYDTAVAAAGSITFTGRPVADETLTICNTTLTAKDSGANGTTQFNTDVASVTVTAAALAACINANTTLNKQVSATSSLGVVTITALIPGVVGNGFDLTESMTNTTKSAFASGAESHKATLSAGL